MDIDTIKKHLDVCSPTFIPPLDSYTNIGEYAEKLHKNAILFTKHEDSKLIGLIAAYDIKKDKIGWITNVSVDPNYKQKGIASQLLKECSEYFQYKKYSKIRLEVFKENEKAIKLYKKHNYKLYDMKDKTIILEQNLRDYNKELKDTEDHKYAYNFDFDVMHPYMLKSFLPFSVKGNLLELGSFKGDFTKRLTPYFDDITCVEASNEAIKEARGLNGLNYEEMDHNSVYFCGHNVKYVNSLFEEAVLPTKYDNIILTHVLEHLDDPVKILKKINDEWLSDEGRLFIVCPNANAPSRQIAVKMGLIPHNSAITPSEEKHGHRITYSLDTLERDASLSGLKIIHRSGIFFKALANFQWDQLLKTDIISKEYLDGCYSLGQQYPDLCSSIYLVCEKGK